MKQCFKCREEKPLSEFYRHPRMADGHLGKCKTCAKRDVAERAGRLGNNPEWLAKERARCREKQERYRRLGLEPKAKVSLEARRRYRKANPHKFLARQKAGRAQRKGRLVKPTACQLCGETLKRLVKHHPDYSQPLQVQWLCDKCHGFVHRKG